jgi:hypothetical protein
MRSDTSHDAAPAAIAQMPDGDHASLGAAAGGRINRYCEPRGHRRYIDWRTIVSAVPRSGGCAAYHPADRALPGRVTRVADVIIRRISRRPLAARLRGGFVSR